MAIIGSNNVALPGDYMKLTKEHLRKIIKEELRAVDIPKKFEYDSQHPFLLVENSGNQTYLLYFKSYDDIRRYLKALFNTLPSRKENKYKIFKIDSELGFPV
jgi:hypothetical protein